MKINNNLSTQKLLLSNCKLWHFTSKPIDDEEDIFKSFMAFDITPCGPVFRVVVGSQIVVLPTIFPSQWHSCDSNPRLWFWYHLSDRELCHSTSKPIGDEEDTLKSFVAFDITPCGSIFRVVVEVKLWSPNNPSLIMALLWLEPMTLVLLPFDRPRMYWPLMMN